MGAFLQRAEDILETAFQGDGDEVTVIVLDRQGGMRILEPTGWTLPALSAEYGATAVYKVERRAGVVRVEGLSGTDRCLLQRKQERASNWLFGMPGVTIRRPQALPQANMLQTSALAVG